MKIKEKISKSIMMKYKKNLQKKRKIFFNYRNN